MGGAGIRFPKLALLLRYLVFTHRMLKTHSDSGSRQSGVDASPEVQDVLSKLLSEDRDPAPFPPESEPFLGQVRSAAPVESFPPHHWRCSGKLTEHKLQLLTNWAQAAIELPSQLRLYSASLWRKHN